MLVSWLLFLLLFLALCLGCCALVRLVLDRAGEYRDLGSVKLAPGSHTIAATAAEARVEVVGVDRATSLCGRPLDWVEALPY